MSLSEELKQLLQRNRLEDVEQVPARNSQALHLNLGTRKVTLVNKYGQATAAGKYFYKLRGERVPDSRWDDNARTYRKPGGRTDFVRMRSGAEVALRTWDPAKKQFDYTAAGRAFYKERPRAYIVQVPVKIFVRRRNGDHESFFGTYPATDFAPSLRDRLSEVEGSTRGAQARIKREVLAHLGDNGLFQGMKVIAEFSDQTVCYNPDGEWSYGYMEAQGLDNRDGDPNTEAVMSRPLNGGDWRFPIKDAETALDEAPW